MFFKLIKHLAASSITSGADLINFGKSGRTDEKHQPGLAICVVARNRSNMDAVSYICFTNAGRLGARTFIRKRHRHSSKEN